MKQKIEPYGVDSKKKVQEITKKFEWKKWSIPIILLGVIIVGGVFSLFTKESEDRYMDLAINEQQAKALEVVPGESVYTTLEEVMLIAMTIFLPLGVGFVVLSSIISIFIRRR